MLMIPAIDLKDGNCVRLRRGDMDDATVFSSDPVAMAKHWQQQGARRLHLVDLNGAFAGQPENAGIVAEIAKALPDLPLQIGGGIRTLKTIEHYLNAGVSWVIIGTQAVKEPAFVKQACQQFPGNIMVGIDARAGKVAINGWAETVEVMAAELAQQFANDGVSAIIYTDIDRDGMMQGVNVEATLAMAQASTIPIIASGGITNINDVRALLQTQHQGISGAITGRAIYEGELDLREAQQLCDQQAI